ncbi:MAG: hypothetical protein RIQ33_2361, partial [Bacteroidota bacterium]
NQQKKCGYTKLLHHTITELLFYNFEY